MRMRGSWPVVTALGVELAGCEGPQNMLDAAGVQAERIEGIWWLLLSVTGVVWLLVVLAMLAAIRYRRVRAEPSAIPGDPKPNRRERRMGIIVSSAVGLTVIVLFVFTLSTFVLERRIFAAPPASRHARSSAGPESSVSTQPRWPQ